MESIIAINKECQNCGAVLAGRINQKYCSDKCRTHSHNQKKLRSILNPSVRNTINALLNNRKVLETVLGNQSSVKITKPILSNLGFNFKYSTNSSSNEKGKTYTYCFDYGYLPLEDDWLLVVKARS